MIKIKIQKEKNSLTYILGINYKSELIIEDCLIFELPWRVQRTI